MEKHIVENIKKFLPHLGAKEQDLEVKNLPLFYRGLYSFSKVTIDGNQYLGINVKEKAEEFGPREFKKHAQFFEEKMGLPIIWLLKGMHPHKIQRLIANGINFIVQEKQVHLPVLNISLKNVKKTLKVSLEINPLGINILIREILKSDLSGLNKLEMANEFQTTKMTMGRALEPLIANGLCEEVKLGISKIIKFQNKKILWDYFRKNIGSPIKEVLYIKRIDKKLPFSGISALAKSSLLAEDDTNTYAVSKKKMSEHFDKKDLTIKGLGIAKVEVWDREPMFIDEGRINPIDLYLVLKEDQDERVQIELENILKLEKFYL